MTDQRPLGAACVILPGELGPARPPPPGDHALARACRIVEQDHAVHRDPIEQDLGPAPSEGVQGPGWPVDHQQIDLGRQVGKIVPGRGPVGAVGDQGRVAQIGGETPDANRVAREIADARAEDFRCGADEMRVVGNAR